MEVTFNRQTIISFPDNADLPDITGDVADGTGGIADGSLLVDEVLYSDRFTIGSYDSNRFEVEIYDYPSIDSGEKIYVYQKVWEDEEHPDTYTTEPIFTGYVESCVTTRGRNEDSKQIVAYDVLYSAGKKDVAEWWEQVFDTETSVSLKTLRNSLLDYMEFNYDDVTLPNDSITIKQTQQLNSISFEAMFKYILQLNAVNANVDREGNIHFVTVDDVENAVDINEVYAQNTTEFDTYTVPAYEGVRINLSSRGISATTGESNYLDIDDNLLVINKSKTALTTIAQAIYNNIKDITYKPAKIDAIWHQFDITVGMWVVINSEYYLVCENYISGTQLVDQHISSNGGEKIEDTTPSYDASKADMQKQISASSLKYYRHYNKRAIEIESTTRPIITIRYTSSDEGVVVFHGCVIIDVERIDDTEEAQTILQYSVNNEIVREYTPTETYHHDGRHTLNLLHFWEAGSGRADRFVVYLTAVNCKVTIGAYRIEAYMEGMGLVGEAVWDGYIDIEDNISLISFANEPVPTPITDTMQTTVDDATIIRPADGIHTVEFANEPNVLPIEATPYINKESLSSLTWGDVLALGSWEDVLDGYGW